MKFTIRRASTGYTEDKPPCPAAFKPRRYDGSVYWYIELNSLEELMKLLEEIDERLIIDYGTRGPSIMVYDDYIE